MGYVLQRFFCHCGIALALSCATALADSPVARLSFTSEANQERITALSFDSLDLKVEPMPPARQEKTPSLSGSAKPAEFRALIHGVFDRPEWKLRLGTQPLKVSAKGRFAVWVPLVGRTIQIQFVAVSGALREHQKMVVHVEMHEQIPLIEKLNTN